MFYGKECNFYYPTDNENGFNVFIKGTNLKERFNNVDTCILWAANRLFIKSNWKFMWDKIEISGCDFMMEIHTQDKLLEAMWNTLEDVNVDEDGYIEQNWFVFEKEETHREYIWHWIDERHSKGVGWLMNEYELEEDDFETKNNLQKVWNDFDIAYEHLEKGIEMLNHMNNLPNKLKMEIDRFDISEISNLKQRIEMLMEDL